MAFYVRQGVLKQSLSNFRCESFLETDPQGCTDTMLLTTITENNLMDTDSAETAFNLDLHYDLRDSFLMHYNKGIQYVNFY